jgi:hypothetical protein
MILLCFVTAVVVAPIAYRFTPYRTRPGRILSAAIAVLVECVFWVAYLVYVAEH